MIVGLFIAVIATRHSPSLTALAAIPTEPETSAGQTTAKLVFQFECSGAPSCVELGDNLIAGKGSMSAEQLAAFAQTTKRRCESGDADQCESLGTLILNGKGVAKDEVKALATFQRACDHGSMSACDDLGAMYGTGTGTRQDLAGAQRLFTKACAGGEEQGCTDATAVAPFAPASK
jgi:hypothetical protein